MPFLPYALRKLSLFFCVLFLASSPVFASEGQTDSKTPEPHIAWQHGPMKADLGGIATIEVPKGFRFADGKGARQVLEISQNPPSGDEVGVLLPEYVEDKPSHWAMFFEFHDTGYISDAEKDKIDASALLKSLQEGTEEANSIRKEKGWPSFHVSGWSQQPFFDDRTKNLTWGILGHEGETDNGNQSVNYSVRILGRKGTVNVDLVIDPKELATVMPTFNSLMGSFSYNAGNRYAEFIKGDKVASYGLTALIAGGAAAAAVKTGLFAKLFKVLSGLIIALWKLIVVAFAALAARFRALLAWIKGLFGKKDSDHDEKMEEQRALMAGDDSNDVH